MFSKITSLLIFLYILISFSIILFQNGSRFTTRNYWENFSKLKRVFYASQYKAKHYEAFIPDETAYSYAGGALIKGENPVFNIPEAPPLGKYLIGISVLIFDNSSTIVVLIAGIAGLIMLYLLGRQILGKSLLSLLPVAITLTEPLYRNQYTYTPLFDLLQLYFLLSIFYFFNKGLQKKTVLFFILTNMFLGFFIATKFYSSGVPIILAFITVLVLNRYWRKLFILFMTLWIPIAILLASYLRVFAYNPSIRQFIGIQRWIFIYWQGAVMLPFTIWDLLLFNRWHTWWENHAILSDKQWNIFWPISTIISFITIIFYALKKVSHKKEIEVIMAFVIWYGAFLSVGLPTVRYFIIYLPFLYIITLYAIQQIYIHFMVKNR